MNDITPPIWRSIELQEESTFWDLHMAIQNTFSWDNAHLHELVAMKFYLFVWEHVALDRRLK